MKKSNKIQKDKKEKKNLNLQKRKIVKFDFIIVLIGIISLMIFILFGTKELCDQVRLRKTQAIVIDFEKQYNNQGKLENKNMIVSYIVNNMSYKSKVNMIKGYRIGNKIDVYYNRFSSTYIMQRKENNAFIMIISGIVSVYCFTDERKLINQIKNKKINKENKMVLKEWLRKFKIPSIISLVICGLSLLFELLITCFIKDLNWFNMYIYSLILMFSHICIWSIFFIKERINKMKDEEMKEKLLKLLDNSYSPYSKFRVAAIAIMKDGKEFNGVNVENASYGAAICAERTAIVSAVANGYKKGDFKKLYIMCDNDKIGMSCFICRQVISELFDKDAIVVSMNPKGEKIVHTVEELCPYPFDEENLK